MINADSLSQIQTLIQQAKSSIVFVRSKPSKDQLLSAYGLMSALKQAGKSVEIACADVGDVLEGMDQSFLEAAGIHPKDIVQKIGNKNLTISFPYEETAVDNVSYHISEDGTRFYLTVKPAKGNKPLDSHLVEFDYSGIEADLFFTVGVHDWAQLEYLYTSHTKVFEEVPVVSVHSFQTDISALQLDTTNFGSIAEGLVWIMEGMQLHPDSQGATALLKSIEDTTNSFKSLAATADTFESVAKLMRMGARRIRQSQHTQVNENGGESQSTRLYDAPKGGTPKDLQKDTQLKLPNQEQKLKIESKSRLKKS